MTHSEEDPPLTHFVLPDAPSITAQHDPDDTQSMPPPPAINALCDPDDPGQMEIITDKELRKNGNNTYDFDVWGESEENSDITSVATEINSAKKIEISSSLEKLMAERKKIEATSGTPINKWTLRLKDAELERDFTQTRVSINNYWAFL